eukprot:Gb_09887 [translate_table: standard]
MKGLRNFLTDKASRNSRQFAVQKEVDPEEDPGFLERNPTWEEELPPIHPVDHDSIFELDSPPRVPLFPKFADQLFVPSVPKTETLPDGRLLARKRWRTAYLGIRRELALKEQATRSCVGFGAQIKGKSCGIWEENDRRRLAIFKLVFNQWNEYFLLAVTVIQCLTIIFKCTYKSSHMTFNIRALDIADAICTSVFTLDCSLRILSLGFIAGKTAYLRRFNSEWHTSQTVILSCGLQYYAYSDS